MSANCVARWRRYTWLALVCSLLLAAMSLRYVRQVQGGADARYRQLQATRIDLQRSSSVLLWLQQHAERLPVLSLEVDELGATLIDAVTLLTIDDGVVDWRFEQHELATSTHRSSATLSRALTLTLVIDVGIKHRSELIALLDQLRSASVSRPVHIRSCRIERAFTTDGRPSELSGVDQSLVASAQQLTGRCELEWPWWEEA